VAFLVLAGAKAYQNFEKEPEMPGWYAEGAEELFEITLDTVIQG
jgi:hypothetical protein